MFKTVRKKAPALSLTQLRQAVADDLRKQGNMTFTGYDNLELVPPADAMTWNIGGTIFEVIAGSLMSHQVMPPTGYRTIGDVMAALGYTDPVEAHDQAHWIGCHCHGPITANLVADRIEGLNS